jgi:hypothetical protein
MKLPGRLRSSACSGQRCTRWERDVSRIREVEAESVAYVLLAHHGLTIGGSSFPYVAGWAATDRVLDILAGKLPPWSAISKPAAPTCSPSPGPEGDPAADLIQHRPRTTQPGDPTPHRRRRHHPGPRRHDPPRWRSPGRATRRLDRRTPLPSASRSSPNPAWPVIEPHRGGTHRPRPEGALRLTNPRITRHDQLDHRLDLTLNCYQPYT